MKKIQSIEQLLSAMKSGTTDFYVTWGSVRSSKSIDFIKADYSQLSVYHEMDDAEEFIDLNQWQDSRLAIYINSGILYAY